MKSVSHAPKSAVPNPQMEAAIAATVGSAWLVSGGREQGALFCNALAYNPVHPAIVAAVVAVATATRPGPRDWTAAALATGAAVVSIASDPAAIVAGVVASALHAGSRCAHTAFLLFEAIAIVWFIVVGGDFTNASTHLTWWSMAALAGFDVTLVVSPRRQPPATALLVLTATVAVGVLFMSAFKCGLLRSTFEELGWLKYALGNVVVHYYPLIRALFAYSSAQDSLLAAGPAVVLVAAYARLRDPATVYECNALPSSWTRTVLVVTSLLLATASIAFQNCGAQRRRHGWLPVSEQCSDGSPFRR